MDTNRLLRAARALVLGLLLVPALAAAKRTSYDVDYLVRFVPDKGVAEVSIRVTPGDGALRQMRLRMPADRYADVRGDGQVSRKGDVVTWVPPEGKPARLRYDSCGIRPKLRPPSEAEERDFVILEEPAGCVHLLGVESPGLTAALALAEEVAGRLR